MKAVLQRVSSASVAVDGQQVAQMGAGLLIYLGITHDDSQYDIDYLVRKILGMRIFTDKDGKMNLSITEVNLEIMVISQFTLYASTRKGNRPSFVAAARPEIARGLYDDFVSTLSRKHNNNTHQGIFQAHMEIQSINDGPVTIVVESLKE